MMRKLFLIFTMFFIASVNAENLTIGALSSEYCYDPDPTLEFSAENQRYWFPRVSPYVGFAKGERTSAGGDGTCYLGFPKASSNTAVVMVDGEVIKVSPDKGSTSYKSNDGKVVVQLKFTGGESTCEPNADKCCGEYSYATITIIRGSNKSSVMAAQYSGG